MPYGGHNWKDFIDHTNISDDMFMFFSISKMGYGYFKDLVNLPVDELLDLIEFIEITTASDAYQNKKATDAAKDLVRKR